MIHPGRKSIVTSPNPRVWGIALAIALLAGGACTPSEDPAAAEQQIRALIERTAQANNAGDVEEWLSLVVDGAVYMPAGQPAITTREELRAIAQAGFSQATVNATITADEIVVMGDWAFARLGVAGTATPAGGADVATFDLKEIALYHRQADGTWKIARLILNSNRS
jgi:uncharacterized protein (TIGR02246 family)